METLIHDIRYGFRMLVKSPAFTLVAVLSLALGIGANTTIFTLINAVFLSPLPVENADRLVSIYTKIENAQGPFGQFSPISGPNFEDFRDQNASFTGMVAYQTIPLNLSGSGDPEQIQGEIVSGNYFDLLGVRAALGRTFLPDEDKTPGTHPVIVLSHGFWKRQFASDPSIVGRTLTLNGHGLTVVGVGAEGFRGTNAFAPPDVWVPRMMHGQVLSGIFAENFKDRRTLLFFVFARLKPGVTLEGAGAELKTIAKRLESEYPEPNRGRSATLLPLAQTIINPNFRQGFALAGGVLMTVVGLVLLIACANVANLLLARTAARRKEIAIRMSLGSGRFRLVRQLMTESVLLSLLGGAAGILIAVWCKDLLLANRPQFFTVVTDLPLDGRVLAFTLAVSLLAGLLFGLAPALQASRPDLAVELKERSGTTGHAGSRINLRSALVVAQVALSLISLVGAGLFLRSLWNTQQVDPGFESTKLAVLSFDLGAQGYDQARAEEFHRRLLDEMRSLPGVRSAALSSILPIGAGGFQRTVFPEGMEPTAGAVGQFVSVNSVTTGYFDTTDVSILKGRGITDADRAGSPLVVVINEAMATMFWKDQDAVGKRFKFYGIPEFLQVVGVAETTKLFALSEDPSPIAYLPVLQFHEPAITLNVRTEGDPAGLLDTLRRRVQALDAALPFTNVQTVSTMMDQALWAPRMGAALLAIFGFVALTLAGIGIYGVMSYSVSQRTSEFGVRMALGARPADVIQLVLRQGMTLVITGLGVGLAGALLVTRLATTLLFGVSATDPITFAAISALLSAVALAAGFIPARRATRVDPVIALRAE